MNIGPNILFEITYVINHHKKKSYYFILLKKPRNSLETVADERILRNNTSVHNYTPILNERIHEKILEYSSMHPILLSFL